MPAEDSANVALVREARLGRSGPDAFYDVLDEDVGWDTSDAPGGTEVRGREAVRASLAGWRHGWEHWHFEEDGFTGAGDRVDTLTADGQACVWTIRDRKVVHFSWYEQAAAGFADAGLEAS